MVPKLKFSVLMAIYHGDKADQLHEALSSIATNTYLPSEVVIVQDGPVSVDLEHIVELFTKKLPIKLVKLPHNMGLGTALAAGVTACKENWIARFDSDDICRCDRFLQQCEYIESHPDVDVLGSYIAEFATCVDQLESVRRVPLTHNDICSYARYRNPFNHMSVMFKKSAVLKAGNYGCELLFEDYALWVRLISNGAKFANIPETLVLARAGNAMLARRGGWRYAKTDFQMQLNWYSIGFITRWILIRNLLLRVPVRLFPNVVRKFIYKKILRR